jgi:hypothetical protein
VPKALALILEHQYTDASLCYDGLKGHDRYAGSHLRESCDEAGFSLYLASFEMTIEGGCDLDEGWDNPAYHEITEECDRTTTLTRVVELDGTEVTKNLEYSEDGFVQDQPFEELPPDDEDYSGFTGNEGVSTMHFYRRTVSILFTTLSMCH